MDNKENFQNFFSCPNCGKSNNASSTKCWKCGIEFAKYENEIKQRSTFKTFYKKHKAFLIIIGFILGIYLIGLSTNSKEIEVINKDENGNTKVKYKLIKLDGRWLINGDYISYYENGRPDTIIEYSYGKRIGLFKKYSNYGKLFIAGKFTNDEKDSLWTYKDEQDRIIQETLYSKGNILKSTSYWGNGTIKKSIGYDRGGNIISEKFFDKDGNDCIIKFIGKYSKRSDGIHSNTLNR